MPSILALFALASWLTALAPSRDEPAFAPEKHLVVEKTLRGECGLEFEGWTVLMQGQPVPAEYLPELEIASRERGAMVVRDEYLASAKGRPSKLRREFISAEATRTDEVSVDGQEMNSTREGTCAIEGCVVVLDETGEGPRRTLEHGECAAEQLDALEIDLDLTDFLPSDAGATEWKVDGSALNLMDDEWAGVEMEFEPTDYDDRADPAQLAANFAGTWQVERGEARDEGGRRVLALAIRGKFTTSSAIDGELLNVPVASGPTRETTHFEIDARGEILWDLGHGVLQSARVDASLMMKHGTATVEAGTSGQPVYSQDMTFRGELTLAIETAIEE